MSCNHLDYCQRCENYTESLECRIADLESRLAAAEADAERLNWLEEQTKRSRTGISFDYVNHSEDGRVLQRGFRFMRRAFIGQERKTLRNAIDAARGGE